MLKREGKKILSTSDYTSTTNGKSNQHIHIQSEAKE
jgi:hypothetical protein